MHLVAAGVLLLTLTMSAPAQPRFEVASVKPLQPGDPGGWRGGPGTSEPARIDYASTLERLIEQAYDVQPNQISGPDWLITARYRVEAIVPAGASPAEFRIMLQTLLAERFGLQLHHETRVQTLYELSVAKGGPHLTAAAEAIPNGPSNPISSTDTKFDSDGCPIYVPGVTAGGGRFGPGAQCSVYRKTSMAALAHSLEFFLNALEGAVVAGKARVVDQTNLTGEYDFKLKFAFNPVFGLPAPASEAGIPSGDGPPLPEALEKQLGLHLAKTRGPADVLVIDHAERVPTQN